jgi:hypothetical protein
MLHRRSGTDNLVGGGRCLVIPSQQNRSYRPSKPFFDQRVNDSSRGFCFCTDDFRNLVYSLCTVVCFSLLPRRLQSPRFIEPLHYVFVLHLYLHGLFDARDSWVMCSPWAGSRMHSDRPQLPPVSDLTGLVHPLRLSGLFLYHHNAKSAP